MKNALAPLVLVLTASCAFFIAGCDSIETEAKYPSGLDRNQTGGDGNIYGEKESIFGNDGLSILGGKKDNEDDSGIGVNSFLWRASLDTVSFMPLASADPFGGVILTDWYMPNAESEERFKINVFILGRQLRSDGVRVRVFKQVKSGGGWKDVEAADETARNLEDAILTRARQLRIAQLDE
ncbi:MAG: DUF3576 domain-containing protein [Alphaproteobacteria bacterium]|nr:DUF3576 domain-containing protein [Alphaproteobacteria bacterium]